MIRSETNKLLEDLILHGLALCSLCTDTTAELAEFMKTAVGAPVPSVVGLSHGSNETDRTMMIAQFCLISCL
jgi:hypothetical protein